MAVVSVLTAIWNTTAGNKVIGPTSVNVGDLMIAVCANSGRTTAQPPTVTDNNSSGTYTQVKSATKNTSADSMWVFVRTTLIPATASTTFTMTQSSDSGGGFILYQCTGFARSGSSVVKQSGSQDNQGAGTPSITLGSAILTTNGVLGAVFTGTNGSANSAPPTSWTESIDQGYNVPASGIEESHRSSGETLTTIAWTAATPSAFASVLVELDASARSFLVPHRRRGLIIR